MDVPWTYVLAAVHRELIVIASAQIYPVYPDWLERLLAPFADSQVTLTYGMRRRPVATMPTLPSVAESGKDYPYNRSLTDLEDLAWAKWVQGAGYAIAYVAEAEVVHVHDESVGDVYNRYWREAMALKRIYSEAHYSLYNYGRNLLANIGFDLLQASPCPTILALFSEHFMVPNSPVLRYLPRISPIQSIDP